jgi:hypothetical protein
VLHKKGCGTVLDSPCLKTGGILLYVEDLKRGTNKDTGPKDIFEIGSK